MKESSGRVEQLALMGLLVGSLLLMIFYSRLTPPLEGYDADAHYLAAVYLRESGKLPLLEREMVGASYELIAQPLFYHSITALAISPWPAQPTRDLTLASVNPYFDKSMSLRQMLVLPSANPLAAPAAATPISVAAWLSMLGNLLTIYGTWRFGRALVPQQWSFALATAALVGLNPAFLFLSVVVTNDTWVSGMAVMCVALATEAALGNAPARRWLWAGAWGGLATLTKYSGFMAGLPAAILWLLYWRRQGWAAAGKALLLALGAGVIVAGWWYVRMYWLYGELIPMQRIDEILSGNRATPLSWSSILELVPWLIWSYWGIFVAVISPAAFFTAVRWLMIGGLVGWVLVLIRRDGESYAAKGWALALVWIWAGATAAAVIYWTRTINYGEQGRLAQIGAPALALLWVIGWQSFVSVRWRPFIHAGLTALMVVLAVWTTQTLQRGFGLPAPLESVTPDRTVGATFGGGPTLVGADFPDGAVVVPGQTMPLTLYWKTDTLITDQSTLFVHVADANNRLLYQFDGVADEGRHPTLQWRPGETFADEHLITVPVDSAPGPATLSVGFYALEDINQRVEVTDGVGHVIGDRLVLGPVYVADPAELTAPAPTAPLATWTNGIVLVESEVVLDGNDPIGLTLNWWSGDFVHQEYTLFAQVLDGENRILAQADLRSNRPTSTWRAGDRVTIPLTWIVAPDADIQAWQRVIVGWYDANGTRLGLQDGGDFAVVARRDAP